jgi:hypothetical protein
MVCSRPSCTSLPVALYPGSETGNAVRWYTTVQAVDAALPQGALAPDRVIVSRSIIT